MIASDILISRFLALHPKLIDLSLGRMMRLLDQLGNPQDRLPPVIHVAGTNGKGSTVAFMRAILESAGLRVHVYTSPHLVRFHERIRLGRPEGGRFVSEEALVAAFRDCEEINRGAPITVFEITTAAAFKLFAETPADVLLLEVGLGGRFDATNVIGNPAATIVTPVSIDHAEYLGDTVEKIAVEKAGIFKRGAPAVIAFQPQNAADVLQDCATAAGASAVWVGGQDFNAHAEGGRLIYQDEDGLLDLPLPRLAGRHQIINAGTAIAGLRAAGYAGLPQPMFERGIQTADWPARMQRLTRGRLVDLAPAGAEIWLDGTHNADGGRVLAEAMADLADRHDLPLVMISCALTTKDVGAILRPFVGLARELIAVPIKDQPAARSAADVASAARAVGLEATESASVADALARLAGRDDQQPLRILICGSLYLAGEVLSENGTPPV